MKRLIFILLITILFFSYNSIAQSLSIADQTAYPCNPISFPVTASGLPTNIGAITLYIQINNSVLQYTGITNGTLAGYLASLDGNVISISWSVPGAGINVNGSLLTLNFNYKGGNCALDFISGCEISTGFSPTPQLVDADFNDGSVSPTPKTTYYVDAGISTSGNGLSWETALKTIHEATNKPLAPGDQVLVMPGNYADTVIIKTNGSELVPVKFGVALSDTNKITFPSGTDLSCVSPSSYPGNYYAYIYRSWKCNNGAYPILSVNDALDYIIVDNSAFIPESGAVGDTSLVQASVGLPVIYKKYSSNPESERVIINSTGLSSSKAVLYIGKPIGSGDSAITASYNIIDGFDLTGSITNKVGLRIQSSSFNVFQNGRIFDLDSVGVYVSGSSGKPAKYNLIAFNKIYNTRQRGIKIGKHGGTTSNSNFAWFTLIKGNEVYVQDDPGGSNDQLYNMVDVHTMTAFTVIEGNTFRSYNSQTADKGTVEIWNNTRRTTVACNFFRDIGKVLAGTNAILYIRNNSLNINVFNNVLINSSLMNDDIFAFRLNATGHSDSKVAFNTVFNIDNGILFEDSSPTAPVFKVQDNILHINYLNGGLYFSHSGTFSGRFTVSHNCYPTVPAAGSEPYANETGRQVGDPLFVNPAFYGSPHGVQLKTGSICIGNGTPVAGIVSDYVKNARSASAPTIGAFESPLTSCFWTGKSSQDWHNHLNWSPELVPTSTIQAVIPLKSNLPVISASNAVCKGLQLQNNATITINNNRLLTVY